MEVPEENKTDSLIKSNLQSGSKPKSTMRTLWDDHLAVEQPGSDSIITNQFLTSPQFASSMLSPVDELNDEGNNLSILNNVPSQNQKSPMMHFNWDTAVERKQKEKEKMLAQNHDGFSTKASPVKGETWGPGINEPNDNKGNVEEVPEPDQKPKQKDWLKPMAYRVIQDIGDSPSHSKYTFSLKDEELGSGETKWDLGEIINIVSKTTIGRTFLEGLKTKGTKIKPYAI